MDRVGRPVKDLMKSLHRPMISMSTWNSVKRTILFSFCYLLQTTQKSVMNLFSSIKCSFVYIEVNCNCSYRLNCGKKGKLSRENARTRIDWYNSMLDYMLSYRRSDFQLESLTSHCLVATVVAAIGATAGRQPNSAMDSVDSIRLWLGVQYAIACAYANDPFDRNLRNAIKSQLK